MCALFAVEIVFRVKHLMTNVFKQFQSYSTNEFKSSPLLKRLAAIEELYSHNNSLTGTCCIRSFWIFFVYY